MSSVSTINPIATLEYLTKSRENQYLERKGIEQAGLKPTKLANELIGMLNADGGMVVLGISDSGDVQNLHDLDLGLLDQYRKVCHDFIQPPANAHLEEVTLPDGRLIFIYHVEQDYERLFMRADNKNVYRRVADSNKGPLTPEQIEKLQYDKSIRSFEDQTRTEFDVKDIDVPTLDGYRKTLDFNGTNDELLIKRNLAIRNEESLLYKNSAILLFAQDPDKYIASSFIRYIRYEGSTQLPGKSFNVVKDERFYGNIPQLIQTLRKFIYASLDDYFYLDSDTGKFVAVSEYPEDAWLEGIVNALFHRSYNLQGNSIYVKHYDDRLEISNSGPLPAQVTIANIREERFSRNPRVGRVLAEMGYVRELNEGVNRIYSSMGQSMLTEPEYSDKNDTVSLVLKNKISQHEKSIANSVLSQIEQNWHRYNDTERAIIEHLFKNYKATIDEFATACGVSPQAIRYYVNKFCAAAIMERHSTKLRDKHALYFFKKTQSGRAQTAA
ncbi:MAG: ATP-binding protein [Candidatus Saccharimonadales bacterium]